MMKKIALSIVFVLIPVLLLAETPVPIEKVVENLKAFNFGIISAGILTDGLSNDEIKKIEQLQFAPPRQMKFYVTQSQYMRDIFQDFTYLINEKKVNAIIIWPSKTMTEKSIMKKIGERSKKKKIPLIVMQEGWLEYGAMLYFKDGEKLTIEINEAVRSVIDYPIPENPDKYTLISK